jgi:hypothetical protein
VVPIVADLVELIVRKEETGRERRRKEMGIAV